MRRKIPLLKEYRLEKLLKCLSCFDLYPYNRSKQRDCVLMEYDMSRRVDIHHWDKSVFRGMVIPSLKYLELLYGEKDEYLLSANGKLLVETKSKYENHFKIILKAIIRDLDEQIFGFLIKVPYNFLTKDELLILLGKEIDIENLKSKNERINKWLNILNQVRLVEIVKKRIRNTSDNMEVNKELSGENINMEMFMNSLFSLYRKMALNSAGIVKIENLRKEVLLDFLKAKNILLISRIFDKILREIPLNTEEYSISLGKPMRAKEGLYFYSGNYYNTIHINFHGK